MNEHSCLGLVLGDGFAQRSEVGIGFGVSLGLGGEFAFESGSLGLGGFGGLHGQMLAALGKR